MQKSCTETKVLSIDLGREAGWCYLDTVGIESGHWHSDTYAPWARCFLEVLDLYKPDLVVCSQTNSFGHFNATKAMYMRYGMICMLCETKGIAVVEFNDSSARKAVFGDGNGKLKKNEAQAMLVSKFPEHGGKTSDELDAIVLAMGWNILNK